MGYAYREESDVEAETGLNEALLFATMCVIGLPVDVHVRDGSVYSGTFYTASVDKEYGVVLKQAKLTKKGKYNINMPNGCVIETLVIFSADLVQVVAKDVLFQAENGNLNMNENGDVGLSNVPYVEVIESEIANSKASTTIVNLEINKNRDLSETTNIFSDGIVMVKDDEKNELSKVISLHPECAVDVDNAESEAGSISENHETDDHTCKSKEIVDDSSQQRESLEDRRENYVDETHGSSWKLESFLHSNSIQEGTEITEHLLNGSSCDSISELTKMDDLCHEIPPPARISLHSSSASAASNSVLDALSESHSSLTSSSDVIPPHSLEFCKHPQGSKLNPKAKIFSPSFTNFLSSTPPAMPVVANMAYIPNNCPVVPVIAAPQSDTGISPFLSRSSASTKFPTTCSNLTTGISGHVSSRPQPLRYAGQYHQAALQAGRPHVPHASQPVMIGHLGQLVYLQPVPNIQSATAIPPVPVNSLSSLNHVQYPKLQGHGMGQAVQLCAPQHPFVAAGQQTYMVPTHFPLLQPAITTNHPLPIPPSSTLFCTSFS